MIALKTLNHQQKLSLLGKTVHMTSNCEFFPNFDIVGKIMSWSMGNNGELIYKCKLSSGKMIDVGTNMKDLAYELV